MSDKIAQATQAAQEEIIRLAESRLGRSLSESEIKGIKSIQSLMMLESIEQGFSYPLTSTDRIEKDLSYFAERAADFQ